MRVQIPLDVTSTETALQILDEVYDYIDIVEVGTPLLLSEGMHAIRDIKKRFSEKPILADTKLMDGANVIVPAALDAGADIVAAMAVTYDFTLRELVRITHERGKLCEVDIMCMDNCVKERAQRLLDFQVDIINYHGHTDSLRRGEDGYSEVKELVSVVPEERCSVANCLNFDTMERVLGLMPNGIAVLGVPILGAKDRREGAKRVREIVDNL